jgi:hypothetical protein
MKHKFMLIFLWAKVYHNNCFNAFKSIVILRTSFESKSYTRGLPLASQGMRRKQQGEACVHILEGNSIPTIQIIRQHFKYGK